MCAKKKKEEEEVGPTWAGVISLALCSLVIGVLLGFIFLASFPVKALASSKEAEGFLSENTSRAPRPDDGYYFEAAPARSRNWEIQRRALLSGDSNQIEVQFSDLNSWTSSMFRPATPPAGKDKPKYMLNPREPKFGTDGEGTVYLILPVTATIFEYSKKSTLYVTGHFPEGGKDFSIDSFHVNNAALPPVPGLSEYVYSTLMQAFSESEEYKAITEAWDKVQSVEVTENSLRIQMQ